jgi:MoxR-like ATPase
VFDDLSNGVAEEAMELYGYGRKDISINKPLRENLFVLLTCIHLNIPVMICGKPGTSKTLAVEISSRILIQDFK